MLQLPSAGWHKYVTSDKMIKALPIKISGFRVAVLGYFLAVVGVIRESPLQES
ncbi:MAG: hypothetical protein AB4080_20475 [Trichodesmium sp.]